MLCQIGSYFLEWCHFQWRKPIGTILKKERIRPQVTRSRYNPKYTTKTVKFGGKSIMVWGAIKADGTRILIRCPDRMNSIGHEEVLKKRLSPIHEAHNTFQQDSTPCLKSKVVSYFLDKAMICVLNDWLAQSPDLNIIKRLWSELKARVSSRISDNIEALWRACEEQWAKIPVPNIKKPLWKHS